MVFGGIGGAAVQIVAVATGRSTEWIETPWEVPGRDVHLLSARLPDARTISLHADEGPKVLRQIAASLASVGQSE